MADKSFLADGCVAEVDDPEQGLIRHVGPLLEFSATAGSARGPAPRSGERTEEVPRRSFPAPQTPLHLWGRTNRSRIPLPAFGSWTSVWGWRGRSRGVSSPTSEPTSSRSTAA